MIKYTVHFNIKSAANSSFFNQLIRVAEEVLHSKATYYQENALAVSKVKYSFSKMSK